MGVFGFVDLTRDGLIVRTFALGCLYSAGAAMSIENIQPTVVFCGRLVVETVGESHYQDAVDMSGRARPTSRAQHS
jgi:hypothetical protein